MTVRSAKQKRLLTLFCITATVVSFNAPLRAADTVEDYIREYPNQQQTRMMNAWLDDNKPGTF